MVLCSLGNLSTASGRNDPGRTVSMSDRIGPSGLLLLRARFSSFHIHSFLLAFSSVTQSYFNLTVSMRKCKGEHSCIGSTFSIVILNGTCSIRTSRTAIRSISGVLLIKLNSKLTKLEKLVQSYGQGFGWDVTSLIITIFLSSFSDSLSYFIFPGHMPMCW